MRDPFTDPQPGDVVELRPGWTRTVTRRVDHWVVFEVFSDGRLGELSVRSLDGWRRSCDLPTARVIRRGDAQNA